MLAEPARADEVDLELHAEQAQPVELAVEGLQHAEVRAVDVDLEIVEIRPTPRSEQFGHDDRPGVVGELGHLPGIVAQLLLGRGLAEPRLAQLVGAHEAQTLADLEDQRRCLLDLDLAVG